MSKFDKAQSVGWVMDRAILIEKRINNVIFNFIEPDNKEVFISHILNSSVMNYGGKLKVLYRIIGYDKESKKLYNDLQRIGSIRNSFAHTDFSYLMSMSFGGEARNRIWSNQVIDVMKSNGEIDSKNPSEFLEEYLNLLKKIERQQTSKMGNQ
ncbi:hypothetical protein [Aquimarina aggregata]|uniref:hypothetical protein n=1 Tax=Aquimarina aggregata TaxID=1642818 RepID=UPI002491B00D|nr:hypothetical protein [Aquimarina aggregata]